MKEGIELKQQQYHVYLFTFPNGKHYCGFTSQKPEHRWDNGNGYKKCPLVWKAIQKYKWENVKRQIIFTTSDKEAALAKEKEVIAMMQLTNTDFGYNLHEGGRPCGNASFLTEKGRQAISEANKKKWANPEFRAYMKTKNIHKLTTEDIVKGRIAAQIAKGENWIPRNAKPVLQIDKDTNEILKEYASGGQAAKALGKTLNDASNILAVCRGKRKTAYGFKWRFKNE